jgi:hypothetical protein
MEAEFRFEPAGLRCTLRLPVLPDAAGRARRLDAGAELHSACSQGNLLA